MGISIGGIVQQLWEEGRVEPGQVILGTRRKTRELHTVCWNHEKGWIIVQYNPEEQIGVDFALYPELRHAEAFSRAHEYLKPGYLRDVFKGAVAGIGVLTYSELWVVDHMQCLYRQEETPGLSRALVSKYGGARYHLLEYLLGLSEQEKITELQYLCDTKQKGGRKNPQIFQEVCLKHGYIIPKTDGYLIAKR